MRIFFRELVLLERRKLHKMFILCKKVKLLIQITMIIKIVFVEILMVVNQKEDIKKIAISNFLNFINKLCL